MGNINGKGQVGHGVGGGNASMDNVPFSPGGWMGWVSDNAAFFTDATLGYIPSLYNPDTGGRKRAIEDQNNPQYNASANTGFAGGGKWACWFGSNSEQRGVYTSDGLHLKDAGLLDVGPNGELGYKALYQSGGPSLCLEPDGTTWQITPNTAYDLKLLGNREAIWMENNQIRVNNLPQPLQVGNIWRPNAYRIDGRWWVSYASDAVGVVLHPFDELVGYILVSPGGPMWYCAKAFGATVKFGLFSSEAEQAGQLTEQVVDTNAPRVAIKAPEQPLVLPPSKALWFGWFDFTTLPSPGNCALRVYDNTKLYAEGNKVLGRFISGSTVEDIEKQSAISKERPVAYWDSRLWPRYPTLPAGSWLCMQAYCGANETPAAFASSMRTVLAKAPSTYTIALVCQQYSTNASLAGYVDPTLSPPYPSAALKDIAPIFVNLANEFPNVIALLMFSGSGRKGGLNDHPDLRQPWQDFATKLKTPSWPDWPVYIPPVPQPKPPIPTPTPVPTPTTPFPSARVFRGRMKIYAQLHGKFIGVDPAHKNTVYADRTAGGSWEEIELIPVANGLFTATFVAANVQLSVQADSRLETRPADTSGPWEQLYATTQPEGINLLYRTQDNMVVGTPLTIIEV